MRCYQLSGQGLGKGGDGEMQKDWQYIIVMVWGGDKEKNDFFF